MSYVIPTEDWVNLSGGDLLKFWGVVNKGSLEILDLQRLASLLMW